MSDIQNAPPQQKWSTTNRVLLGVCLFLGFLIIAAFLGLIYGAITGLGKAAEKAPAAAAPPDTASLQSLPPGAQIVDMRVDHGRTILRLKTKQGEEIDIYDTQTGKLITRIAPK